MLIEVYDDDVPAVVWLFCGTKNDDDDFARWLSSMRRLDRAMGGRNGAGLLLIDDGNPPPRGEQRDGLTATARAIAGDTPLAVVTSSALARTIISGLRFTGVVRFPLKGFADVDGACAWLQSLPKRAPALTDQLKALVDEARARQSLKTT